MPILLILYIVTCICSSILPSEVSTTMHFTLHPLAFIFSPVRPYVSAITVDVILEKLPSVAAAVGPCELTYTMLLSHLVVSRVLGPIMP